MIVSVITFNVGTNRPGEYPNIFKSMYFYFTDMYIKLYFSIYKIKKIRDIK